MQGCHIRAHALHLNFSNTNSLSLPSSQKDTPHVHWHPIRTQLTQPMPVCCITYLLTLPATPGLQRLPEALPTLILWNTLLTSGSSKTASFSTVGPNIAFGGERSCLRAEVS
mmetsp:Transcript_25498/g.55464  ORF Transcript_25498/g.55464 Transcript_25498/m.55464 type:complete len:112 (+) Transcript_25498:346-681(+)